MNSCLMQRALRRGVDDRHHCLLDLLCHHTACVLKVAHRQAEFTSTVGARVHEGLDSLSHSRCFDAFIA